MAVDGERRPVGSTGGRGMAQLHQALPLIERLHALIEELRVRAPRTTPGAVLAERLGVSVRTVERDIARLLDAGIPVEAVRGAGGGYGLAGGWEDLPIRFTPGEVAALVATLTAIGPLASASAASALAKLLEAIGAPD